MIKIISIDENHHSLNENLRKNGFKVEEFHSESKSEIEKIIHQYQGIIIRSRFPLDESFLKKASNLKFIARVGAGMENIDSEFAKKNNILLINASEGNRDSVAEHCLGMLLMLMHRIKISDFEVRNNIWKRAENRGDELMHKTVGIIGYGIMGKAFAKRLSGFNVNVLCYDIIENIGDEFAVQVDLKTILNDCEVISLHLPQNESTHYFIDKTFVNSMKNPFYLINSARGQCVKLDDLVEGIESNKIKAACLDVLEYEKSSFEVDFSKNETMNYLKNSQKVVLTPHIAGWSIQSNEKMAKIIVEKILTS